MKWTRFAIHGRQMRTVGRIVLSALAVAGLLASSYVTRNSLLAVGALGACIVAAALLPARPEAV